MIYKLRIERTAKLDVAEAYRWYKNINSGLADRFYNCLDTAYAHFITNPQAYPVVGIRLRRVVLQPFSYAVYYLCEHDTVRIFAIMHTSRNPVSWKKREH